MTETGDQNRNVRHAGVSGFCYLSLCCLALPVEHIGHAGPISATSHLSGLKRRALFRWLGALLEAGGGAASHGLLTRRQDHDHLTPFEPRLGLHLREYLRFLLDLEQELHPDFLMRHLAPAESERHFHLVALVEETLHRFELHVIVMRIDIRPQLDFFDFDSLCFLPGLRSFLLSLIFVLAEIHNFADRRSRIPDFDEIETGFLSARQGFALGYHPEVFAAFINELYFPGDNRVVDPGTVLRWLGFKWSTNEFFS